MVQRVSAASVTVNDRVVGEIGKGILILLGVADGDTENEAVRLAARCRSARIFPDQSANMNLDVTEVGGSALVVSQFTLCADTSRGRRPSFARAAHPSDAEPIYAAFCSALESDTLAVKTGVFGAQMEVSLVNDGPVTLLFEA